LVFFPVLVVMICVEFSLVFRIGGLRCRSVLHSVFGFLILVPCIAFGLKNGSDGVFHSGSFVNM
ncbi:hypothetical protein, partial [Enterococcus faecalis]|uniref:hypothetical protein n=1 Tax=Enterococcus faecalis TaxID=1351 RepID=UPI003CC5918B